MNVGGAERWFSAVAGGVLFGLGVRRPSTVGGLLAAAGGMLLHRGITGSCMGYRALGIDTAHDNRLGFERELAREFYEHGIHVDESMIVNRPASDLYRFWRKLENLPRVMSHLQAVQMLPNGRSHWIASAPLGQSVEWEAEVINDEPDELIAWRSLPGSTVDSAGSVRFRPAPNGRGTIVRVVIEYIPPAGRLGSMVARLFGEEPSQQVRDDLRRFKHMMETAMPARADTIGTASSRERVHHVSTTANR